MKLELTATEWQRIAEAYGWTHQGDACQYCVIALDHDEIIDAAKSLRLAAWKLAYARACRHDGITKPNSHLVIFSKDNPHAQAVNEAAFAYFELEHMK